MESQATLNNPAACVLLTAHLNCVTLMTLKLTMGTSEFKVGQVHNKKLACTGLNIHFVTTMRSLSIQFMNIILIWVSGLGVLLVVVVGVGWKCTPRGHEPLHALFNLGDFRRRSRRPRERRRRDGRWYGGKEGEFIS